MNSFVWLIGGIISALLLSAIFLQVFSNMTFEKHRQDSIKSFNEVVSNANKFCDMNIDLSSEFSITFSSLVSSIFAYTEDEIVNVSDRTVGDRLCMNISGEIYCDDIDCLVEVDKIENEKSIATIIDKAMGRIGYREYQLNFVKTKCGVSILKEGSNPRCSCGSDLVETKIYCESGEGAQNILSTKENFILLADTYNWDNASSEIGILLNYVSSYGGGGRILIVFEDNFTSPEEPQINAILNTLPANIEIRKHSSRITNFSSYNQVWLVTPGFCEGESRQCFDYMRWSEEEIDDAINYVNNKEGTLFLITDSGMRGYVIERIGLRVINRILEGVNYPYEQILSYVCGGSEDEIFEGVIQDTTLSLSKFDVNRAASMICRYQYAP